MESFEEFVAMVTGRGMKNTRRHKVTGSWGLHDAYLRLRKQGWTGVGRALAEKEFSSIVKTMNRLLAEELENGGTVTLPCRMGVLEVRRRENKATLTDGGLHVGYPVDWRATLKLWYTDGNAREEKRLLRVTDKARYRVCYRKFPASYANKSFYEFLPNRELVRILMHNINEGRADTLW